MCIMYSSPVSFLVILHLTYLPLPAALVVTGSLVLVFLRTLGVLQYLITYIIWRTVLSFYRKKGLSKQVVVALLLVGRILVSITIEFRD